MINPHISPFSVARASQGRYGAPPLPESRGVRTTAGMLRPALRRSGVAAVRRIGVEQCMKRLPSGQSVRYAG